MRGKSESHGGFAGKAVAAGGTKLPSKGYDQLTSGLPILSSIPDRKALLWIGSYKAFLLALTLAIATFTPTGRSPHSWGDLPISSLGERVSAWDGMHYLRLSEFGYERGSPSCAFYPLWPFLIRMFSTITFTPAWVAAVLLSTTLGTISAWLLYRFVKEHWNETVARDSVILMLAFPGALFFSVVYTESLFLTLCLLCFMCLYRGDYGKAAVFAFLLPLTKAIGIFILFPIVWKLIQSRASWRSYFLCYAPLLGYGLYFLIMHRYTGNAFEGFDAQKNYPNQPSVTNLLDFAGLAQAFTRVTDWHNLTGSGLDRVLFVMFIIGAILTFRLDRTLFIFILFAGLMPAAATWFVSYSRNVMMSFPIFIAFAMMFGHKDARLSFGFWVGVLWIIQGCLLYRLLHFEWAG